METTNLNNTARSNEQSVLCAAYLIHSRPFSETSLIVELFTESHGRVAAVANGAKRKNNINKSLLQPFRPLLVSWRGHGDLKTLIRIDSPTLAFPLAKQYLYSGLYLNELVMRLLAKEASQPIIYSAYHATLLSLSKNDDIELTLRQFELSLLSELGHGFSLLCDVDGQSIEPNWRYDLLTEQGFISRVDGKYIGQSLINIANTNFCDTITRNHAKLLTRQALTPLLGNKPLQSRRLFSRSKSLRN